MKRFESRYCAWEAPSDWEPEPPAGCSEPGGAEGRMRVQVVESWLPEPASAHEKATRHLESLPHLLHKFEMIDEGPAEGDGDRYRLRYRYLSDVGDMTLETRLVVVHGPLACEMTMSRVDEDDDERQRILEAIGQSLELERVEFLSNVLDIDLLDPSILAEGAPGSRTAFPHLCSELTPPPDWQLGDDPLHVAFELGAATIRGRRVFGGIDADKWLEKEMESLRGDSSLLLNSRAGELNQGVPYAAVLADPSGAERRWSSAAELRSLAFLLDGPQPIEWRLRCPKDEFERHHPTLQRLVKSCSYLDPKDWLTSPPEPWLDVTLTGGWRAEGDGVYVDIDSGFVFLYLNRLPCKVPLDHLASSIADNLRSSMITVEDHSEARGLWNRLESYRYAADGTLEDGRQLSLRTVWIAFEQEVYCVLVQSTETSRAESVFTQVLQGLRIASGDQATP